MSSTIDKDQNPYLSKSIYNKDTSAAQSNISHLSVNEIEDLDE
jgi:hypothetical protein